jgi:hypothetical protein
MLNNLYWSAFSIIDKFSQQSKIQIFKSSDFGGIQLLEVGKKNNCQNFILGFQFVLKYIHKYNKRLYFIFGL